MWDLPGPGLEPVSPALAGGFLTTAPPGKPPFLYFKSFLPSVLVRTVLSRLLAKPSESVLCLTHVRHPEISQRVLFIPMLALSFQNTQLTVTWVSLPPAWDVGQ